MPAMPNGAISTCALIDGRGGGRAAWFEADGLGFVDRRTRRELQLGLRCEIGRAHLLRELLYPFEVLGQQRQTRQLVRNRDHHLGFDLVHDLGRLGRIDMAATANRHEKNIDLAADRIELILRQRVAAMAGEPATPLDDYNRVVEIISSLGTLFTDVYV